MKLTEPYADAPGAIEPRAGDDYPADNTAAGRGAPWIWIPALLLIVALGIFIRVSPSAAYQQVGFDEKLYRDNVVKFDSVGVAGYPEICEIYLEDQRKPETITKLPPTRFLYIYSAWLWKRAEFGDAPPTAVKEPDFAKKDPALISLHRVAALFTTLLFLISGVCAWRMLGRKIGLGVFALLACAPTQIHMAQHALIDGFFAFWAMLALWLLWENLQRPSRPRWIIAYGLALACLVLTKENSFFVFIAICGLLAVNKWTQFGVVNRNLLIATVAGPAVGVFFLIALTGDPSTFVSIYKVLVAKAQTLDYAIRTGDGPWYRYLVDLMIVSPLVLCLALGGLFTAVSRSRPLIYLSLFFAFSYVLMCNVKYAMNLRYATIWELTLCALAAVQIHKLALGCGRRAPLVNAVLLTAVCAYSLRQYQIFFVDVPLYELVTGGLLHAVKILK